VKKKKAGIYDRWLSTLGGGEQVAFAYAETLRDLGYSVELLTHGAVDLEKAEKKMNVNLKDINIKYLPEKSTLELSEYSEKYDFFINTSYLDYFPSRAKKSLLSVFFPGEIYLSPFEFIKRAFVIPSLKILFIYPIRFEGFSFDQIKNGVIYKWIKNESKIIFNKPIDKICLDIYIEKVSFSILDGIGFYSNDKKIIPISKTLNHNNNIVTYKFDLEKEKDITIRLPNEKYKNNIALTRFTIPKIKYFLYNAFKSRFPRWEMRLHGGAGITPRSYLESYSEIITISKFCRKWIKKYWGLPSTILYPPVNTKAFSPAKNKKNHIIHIGRFFVTGHSKKQLEMTRVFKKMVDKYKLKNWELHFIGSIESGSQHQDYYNQVKTESKDYPIHIHTDMSFLELKKMLSEAKIYWHATGLGENEEKAPILFEHFGITTIEAMASGCVPVVIAAGGQPEIVDDESGFKWKTEKELMDYTHKLIKSKNLLSRLSKGAVERSKFFSRGEFKKNFKRIIER
jgi:glycosyltransferase involved in cell wall biosynthesis